MSCTRAWGPVLESPQSPRSITSIAPVVFMIEAPDEHVGKFFLKFEVGQWQQRVILLVTAPERWLQILEERRLPDVDGRYQYRVLVPGAATSG